MSDDIGFESGEKKVTPEIMNAEVQKMKTEAIKRLEKTQIDKQVRAEAGITEIPKEPESIPKELPKLIFSIGSKAISCDRFKLDEDESKMMAKHLSILVGAISSKWYSAIIVIIITLSKISDCFSSVSRIMHREKKEKQTSEMKEQGRPAVIVYGDGTN